MITNKLAMANLLSTWPLIGKRFRKDYITQLLAQLDTVEKSFDKVMVRFSHNIHNLHNALQGFDCDIVDDYPHYKTLSFPAYTKTSNQALKLLQDIKRHSNTTELETYFKGTLINPGAPFLDWYSNRESVLSFIGGTVELIKDYVEAVPYSDDGTVFAGVPKELNHCTQEFVSSRYFKLLILDFINALRIVLYLEVKGRI